MWVDLFQFREFKQNQTEQGLSLTSRLKPARFSTDPRNTQPGGKRSGKSEAEEGASLVCLCWEPELGTRVNVPLVLCLKHAGCSSCSVYRELIPALLA